MQHHATLTALVWGSVEPLCHIYHEPPCDPNDSGFGLVLSDAPWPEPEDTTPIRLVCFDCVLDRFRGIGRGLELAREHGAATLADGGEWKPAS